MKKTFLFLATCLAMTMAATSCGDFIETSDNGDLDGYWQLSQVDTLANGVQVDMTSSKVFWGVQGKFLTMLDTRQAPSYGYMFRFEHRADSLLLSDGRVNNRDVNDTLLTNVDVLRPLGVNELDEHFFVERLTGNRMVLRGKMLRLHFRKF